MPHPVFEFGGSGPTINLSLANGFPPHTYHPLLDPLTGNYRVMCLLPRPLWPEPPDPSTLGSWHGLADDLISGLDHHGLSGIIGIGHSVGGITTMLAAVRRPDLFRALILLDPTALPPLLLWGLRLMKGLGLGHRFPLVKTALNRRARFSNRQEAFNYWRPKSLFRDWADDTLWHYVDGLTESDPDSDGLRLAWSPEWEARVYRTVITDPFRQARGLHDMILPVLFIRGSNTNTFTAASASRMRRVLPNADYRVVEGHGHLFPQTAPNQTRAIIETWLEDRGIGT